MCQVREQDPRSIRGQEPAGLLVVDKPSGPTSHDIVAQIRRTLGLRGVGHAGTLDPMASGVLLVLVGQCTKLSRFLSLENKAYEGVVRFGEATDTLDAAGRVVTNAEVPERVLSALAYWESHRHPNDLLARALDDERERTVQVPPAHSAIKQAGKRSYVRARQGNPIALPARPVQVFDLHIQEASAPKRELVLRLAVSKGYYVRSLARDLGEALGVPAHLRALRRTRCGPYSIEQAQPADAPREELLRRMIQIADVARRTIPCAQLNEHGVRRALSGQSLDADHFAQPPPPGFSAWLGTRGDLVAVGGWKAGRPVVVRGFSPMGQL